MFCCGGIRRLYKEQWYQACTYKSIPPSLNWTRGEGCTVFQLYNEDQTTGSLKTKPLHNGTYHYENSPGRTIDGSKADYSIRQAVPQRKRERVVQRQLQQKNYHDQRAVDSSFEVQHRIFFRNYGRGPFWLPGVTAAMTGPVSDSGCVDSTQASRSDTQEGSCGHCSWGRNW